MLKRFRISHHARAYIIKGADPFDGKDISPKEMLEMMMESWISHIVSTEPMKLGHMNDDPVLNAIRGIKGLHILDVYECGLFHHKRKPWFAVSPDGVLFSFSSDAGLNSKAL